MLPHKVGEKSAQSTEGLAKNKQHNLAICVPPAKVAMQTTRYQSVCVHAVIVCHYEITIIIKNKTKKQSLSSVESPEKQECPPFIQQSKYGDICYTMLRLHCDNEVYRHYKK